jgi:septal ring factor EnvC (AmiA/AmiB activator)
LKFSFVTKKANARLMVAFTATIFLKYPDMGEKDLIAQLRARIAQLEKENKELREKLAAAETENKRSKDLIIKLENDTRTAQTKIMTLEKENKEQIEKSIREMEADKTRLTKQYEDRIRELEERSKRTQTENGTQR